MARRVSEIMNLELFSLRGDETAPEAVRYLLSLGVSGAPVENPDGRPRGVVSLKDLASAPEEARVRDLMTEPAGTVPEDTEIPEAARLLSDLSYHRLVVVDAAGRAVGLVTSLDLLRGVMGLPARHGEAFPHRDPETGVFWTDDFPLAPETVDAAPDGPGVLALIWGGAGHTDVMVWAEETLSVRARLTDMISTPQPMPLGRILQCPGLLFRAARESSPAPREEAVARLKERMISNWPWEEGRPC